MAWIFLKVLGASSLILGSAGIGMRFSKKYRMRPLELRQIMVALRMLRADITYQSLPLPESFSKISNHFSSDTEIGQIFKLASVRLKEAGTSAEIAFSESLQQVAPNLSLGDEDFAALLQFSHTVGTTGAFEQAASINAVITELRDREQEAVADRERFEKIYRTAGILIGVMIVVMLW